MVGIPYGLLYLLAAPRSIWKRIAYLALAGLLLLAISLSWALAVDLTPASLRPYVGSSQNNSEISLALGHNGINRLLGQFGIGGRTNTSAELPHLLGDAALHYRVDEPVAILLVRLWPRCSKSVVRLLDREVIFALGWATAPGPLIQGV